MVELKQNAYAQSQSTAIDAGLREYMMKVYNYMTSGLAISGLVAWGFSQSPALMGAIYGTGLQWVVMLAPLGFIFFLGARLQKMSLSAAADKDIFCNLAPKKKINPRGASITTH